MAVAIGQITIIDVLDGEQGPPGIPGEDGAIGPPGTPGFLGLIVSGSTLSLKGFDSDGVLQASVGYIYIDGDRHAVPEYSLDVSNGGGQGYIVFNPSWTSQVRFAKMTVDSNSIIYKDYSTLALLGTPAYVIGKFHYDQSISKQEILNPQSTQNFQTSNFMEILNSDDLTNDINQWAEALGVTQVFQRIAVLEAFINKLVANQIRVGGGSETAGFLFKAEVVNSNAVISAYFEGDRVFHIDGNTGSVEMAGTGKFLGLIESEPMVTQAYEGGGSIPSSPSKSLWSTDELYSELTTIAEQELIQSASGSYGGKTITALTRLSSSVARAIVSYYSLGSFLYSAKGSSSSPHITYLTNETVPSGCSYIRVTVTCINAGGGDDEPFIRVYRNGGTPVIGQEYVYGNIAVGDSLYADRVSHHSFETHAFYLTVNAGDRMLVAIQSGKDDEEIRANYVKIDYFSPLTGQGVFVKYSDNAESIIAVNQRRNDALTLTSPSWATSGNLNYISGTDFYNSFASLSLGISTPCSGSLNINGTPYSPLYVTKQADSIKFQMSNDVQYIYKWGGQGSLLGVYTSLSCSLTITGQLSAVKFNNLISLVTNGGTIGQGSNRVNAYFGTNMDVTTINSAGTSNVVYGAVFN